MHLALRNQRRLAPALGTVLLLIFSLTILGQNPASAPQPTPPATHAAQQPPPPAVPLTPAQQRAAQLAADTAQLQDLAAQLKAAMAQSTKDTLSFSVIKKAQEVEKLAHKVRDEMRSSLTHGS